MNNKILNWFLHHPIATVFIALFVSGILELYIIEPINDKLQLKYYFTEADMMLMGSFCLVMGIYCVSTINTSKQPKTDEVK